MEKEQREMKLQIFWLHEGPASGNFAWIRELWKIRSRARRDKIRIVFKWEMLAELLITHVFERYGLHKRS